MRILIVHNTLNDSKSVSGVLRHYALSANVWSELGHPTDFLVARAGFPQLQELAPGARLISSDGWFNATRHIEQTWRYFPAYAYRMATSLWLPLPASYDVVYASHQFIVEVFAAMVLARRMRSKIVVKIQHVLSTQTKRSGLIDRLFLAAERRSVRWIHRHADLLLALSRTTAREYQAFERQLGLSPKPIEPIGCGIDLSRFAAMPERTKRFDAVFLGRIHEQKGVFDLPRVWAEVLQKKPNAKLLVIGEGPHRPRMTALFHELGLSDSVTIAGGVSETKKIELLAESRLGLSLSYEEGWGLSVTEFLAAGLPVAAYDLPVFAEVFPERLVLAPLGDRKGFAAKTLALLDDPARRDRLGAAGKEFVQRYDDRTVARQELEALLKTQSENPR